MDQSKLIDEILARVAAKLAAEEAPDCAPDPADEPSAEKPGLLADQMSYHAFQNMLAPDELVPDLSQSRENHTNLESD